jgi:hypothetical protein
MNRLIAAGLCVLFICGTAMADWTPAEPAESAQLPDLIPTGTRYLRAK